MISQILNSTFKFQGGVDHGIVCPAGLEVIANIGKATSRSTFIYLVDYTIMSLIVSSTLAQLYLQSKTKYTMVDCFPTSHFRAFDLHKTELEEEHVFIRILSHEDSF